MVSYFVKWIMIHYSKVLLEPQILSPFKLASLPLLMSPTFFSHCPVLWHYQMFQACDQNSLPPALNKHLFREVTLSTQYKSNLGGPFMQQVAHFNWGIQGLILSCIHASVYQLHPLVLMMKQKEQLTGVREVLIKPNLFHLIPIANHFTFLTLSLFIYKEGSLMPTIQGCVD